MIFPEFLCASGRPVAINPACISRLWPVQDGTLVTFTDGKAVELSETYEQVKARLERRPA